MSSARRTPTSSQLATWILRQDGRARPLAPPELIDEIAKGLEAVATAHEGRPPRVSKPAAELEAEAPVERPVGPVAPERFAVLQALLAHLLARCGEGIRAVIPAEELTERFNLTDEQLGEHLALLNLVNFGGGCYAVYAARVGDEVRVQKELFGDTFRRAPRLTPLEARAIRLALEFVGPMIAAEAHTPLDRVRRKLEETFGEFEVAEDAAEPEPPTEEEELVRAISDAIENRTLVEIEYLAVGEEPSLRVIEPHALERELPWWYVHSWDRSRDAQRSFRLDRMRAVRPLDETFEPRPDLEPTKLLDVRTARVLFRKAIAPWRIERGAQELADGTALEEMRHGSVEWLVGEILSYRGTAVVVAPPELREAVAKRARVLQKTLTKKRRATAKTR